MATVKYLDENGLSTVWSKVKGIVTPKADKVSGATNGHLAGLNSSGNLTDSGLAATNVAQKDGSYSGMTVGAAEDLVSAESVASEFTSRITGGSTAVGKGGTALVDKIKGRTLVWNQRVKNGNFESTLEWTPKTGVTFTVDNNTATVTSSASGDYYVNQSTPFVVGHKYMFSCDYNAGYTYGNVVFCYYGSGNDYFALQTSTSGVWRHEVRFFTCSGTTYNLVRMQCGVANATNYYRNIQIFDLTLMYGSGNEPSTAAEFEALYPDPYYDYNPGTLISNAATAIETVGRNLIDITELPRKTGRGTIDGDGAWYLATPESNLLIWENTIGYTGRVCITFNCKYADSSRVGQRFKFILTDGTQETVYPTAGASYHSTTASSPSGKIVSKIVSDYGSNLASWIKDLIINFSDPAIDGTYEPYWRSELELGLGDIKVKSHNLWDEEWEVGVYDDATGEKIEFANRIRCKNPIPISPSTSYYFSCGVSGASLGVIWYDVNNQYISKVTATNLIMVSPANARYVTFYVGSINITTYSNNICINLSDPSFNGRYEPYGDGGVISITGGLKSAGTVYDEISGGKFIKRIDSMDLGAMSYNLIYGDTYHIFQVNNMGNYVPGFPSAKQGGYPGVCPKFINASWATIASYAANGIDDAFCLSDSSIGTNSLCIRDTSYTDAATFKAAMSGVPLYYELAKPIEYELAEAIPTAMRNDPYGTERRLPEDTAGTVLAPFRADITYSTNIKEAVQSLPQNYININSMQDFLAALGTLMDGTWTMRPADGKFDFTFTPNPSNE